MEKFTIAISLGAFGLSILNTLLNRRDKLIENTKEENFSLINYKLEKLQESLEVVGNKLDKYVDETNAKIEKAIKLHERIYHGGN